MFVDPLWKPSRQARGIVCYEAATLTAIRQAAQAAQYQGNRSAGRIARTLRRAAEQELRAVPWALFGLEHNWLQENEIAWHLAILASDMRAGANDRGREALKAHELLNAAARAGRAGHLANGVVLLIPEKVIGISLDGAPSLAAKGKLRSILPEDDRCLEIQYPLQVILDRISASDGVDEDVEYALNRMVAAIGDDDQAEGVADVLPVTRSFAAFVAAQAGNADAFAERIEELTALLQARRAESDDAMLRALAAQSGASIPILARLRARLTQAAFGLPQTIPAWIDWILDWLADDEDARIGLLGRQRGAILAAAGGRATAPLTAEVMRALRPGLQAWLSGAPLCRIEVALRGDITSRSGKLLPRTRPVVTVLIPMGLSFVAGLVGRVGGNIPSIADANATPRAVLECLPAAVRRGFDSPAKLAFAELKSGQLSRVQTHRDFSSTLSRELIFDADDDFGHVLDAVRSVIGGH